MSGNKWSKNKKRSQVNGGFNPVAGVCAWCKVSFNWRYKGLVNGKDVVLCGDKCWKEYHDKIEELPSFDKI